MSDKKTKLKATIIKLRSIFSRISVHYFAYTIAFLFVTFSVMHFVTAATPNPGHPWNEIGDGVFAVTYNQTAPRTYTFPDANATVLTTNDTVTVAQGGTGLSSIASGSVLVANTINTLSALTSTTGTKVLTNTNGSITWGTAPDSMVYPSAGIAVSTGSAWGTSITDNSSNWNTAYGWGNHASAGYLLSTGATTGATSQAQLFTNGIISPTILGGTSTTQDLTFKTTSGVGTTGADMHFLVGNNGATEAMTILNNGNVGIGTTAPVAKLDISDIGSQLRLSYDLTNYSELTTNTNGNLNIKTKGVSNFFIGNETVISGYSNIWPGGVTPSSSNYTWQNKNDGTEIWFNAAGASGQIYFDINNSATVPLFIKGSNVSIGFLYSAVPTSLFNVNGSAYFAGNIGIGQTSPTARLHLPAGTATAGTAPLKLTAGTNLTTPEAGAIEFNGTDLFFTPSTTRETIAFVSDLPSLLGYVPYTGATTNLDLGSYDLFMTGSIGKTESRLTKGWFTDLEVTNAIVGSITGNAGTVTNGLYTTTGLMLDQTTPQTLINGIPLLAETRVINEAHQLVDKAYVDEAFASLGAKFYMLSTPSGIGTYYNTQTTPSIEAEGSITATDPADGGFIAGWISPSTGSPTKLIKGVYDWDIFVEKTGGNKVYRIYWTLVERKADTSEVVIATSANSNLIGSKSKQIVPLTLPNDYSLANGSRVVGKVYAKLESGASATNLVLYLEGLSDSHWETPTNKEILDNSYVTYTGAINNVNLGSNNLTTPLIIGGTATTSPLTLRSTSGVGTTGADIIFQTGNNGATEAMRILNNGFVGINDDAPTHRFSLMDDSVNYASLIWQQNAAGSGQYIGVNNTDSTKDALEVENSSGPIFTIKNNGNVGIGEYSPTSALTLGGSGTKAINRSVNTGNINIYGGTDYTNGAFFKLTGNSLNADPGNSSGEFTIGETTGTYASKFGIYSYNGSYWTSRFVVVGATGRVSIGAGNTPTAMLHIKAGTATAGTAPLKLTAGVNLTTPEAGAVEWDGTNLFVTQTTGPTRKTVAYTDSFTSTYVPYTGATTNVNLGSYSLTTPLVLGGTSTTQDLTFQTTSGVGATGADMHFLLGNNGATEAMTILNNGNVGIGTTSPSEKLEVGGDITANRIFATGSSSSNPGITIRGSRANLLFDTTGVTGGVAFDLIEAKVTNTDPVTAQWGNVGLFGSANLGGSPEASYMYFDALPDGAYNNTTLKVDANNRIGIGLPSTTRPTARLHLPAGTATAGTAPLKLTAGVNLTTPEAGVIEFDGTDLFFTPSTTRETVAFMSDITAASHDAVTLGTANGLSLSTQQLSLATASGSTTGALTSTDWNTFNNKQAALVSGTNIKTINSTSLLGSGDIAIAPMVYPGAGIPNSTGSAWGTSYTTSGSGTTLALTTTPTFTTNITTPLILGGTSTTQDLTFQTTSGIGTTGADMHFLVGNNGATEAMTILNNGNVGIGGTNPEAKLEVEDSTNAKIKITGTGPGNDAELVFQTTNGEAGIYLDGDDDDKIKFYGNYGKGIALMTIDGAMSRNVGIGTESPTAVLHLKAGTSTASTAPFKLTAGTNLTTPEAGAVEFDGTDLFFTPSTTRETIAFMSDITASPITIVNTSNLFSTGLTGTGSGVTTISSSNFFGANAGNSATSASYSNFLGDGAGYSATNASYSNFLGSVAGNFATNASYSNFLGNSAGNGASSASYSNFLGDSAGLFATNAANSNFLGNFAGNEASYADHSNFFGAVAGYSATNADNSNFLGNSAGYSATNASYSNFFGAAAGNMASAASYSNLFGYQAGMFYTGNNIGSNNIIIGTNISLPDATANAINLGGVLFAKNTYSTTSGNPSIAATATGSIGIGVVNPTARLHLPAGTATAGTAPLKLTAGVNLTTPEAGAMEFDGTDLFFTPSTTRETIAFISDLPSASPITIVNTSNLFSTGLTGTGSGVTTASNSIFLGVDAGNTATNVHGSNFLGEGAGYNATYASDTNFFGKNAGYQAASAYGSNFIGYESGYQATNAEMSNFFGSYAGKGATNAYYSNFMGENAGLNGINASYSNFFGYSAGSDAADAELSNFIGMYAGRDATNAEGSNFLGYYAGESASDASYSNLFGYRTGTTFTSNNIGSNNIIIGTNISLPNATANAINLGGVLFAKNTYSTTTGNPSITGTATGSIGIGIVPASISARLHLPAGTATAGTAPLKLTAGVNLTTPEAGAMEFDGTDLFFTPSTTRETIAFISDLPSLSGYVPYTGATSNVNLGTYNITTSAVNNLNLSQDLTDFNVKVGKDAGLNLVTGAQYNTFLGYEAGKSAAVGGTDNADRNTAIGYQALTANTTGGLNVAVGESSMITNTGGSYNTALGVNTLWSNETGNANVALGIGSMMFNISGNDNIAIGMESLYYNETGSNNISLGYQTMLDSWTGSNNIAIGDHALRTNDSGSNGLAIGHGAMRYANSTSTAWTNSNTAIGYESMYGSSTASNNTGNQNTALGYQTLMSYSSGGNNTALGYYAGRLITTGGNNTLLGYSVGDTLTTGGNNIAIGYDVDFQSATGSNQLTIGNLIFATGGFGTGTTVGTGNIGIALTSPTARLHLHAGTATAGTAPLKLTAGVNLTTPEAGAVEFDGTDLFFTPSTTRETIAFMSDITASPITIVNTSNLFSTGLTGTGSGVTTTNDSIFLGVNAGYQATWAYQSNFIGYGAGYNANSADSSNFIGYRAGYNAEVAFYSNFFGLDAGNGATNADSSNFLGGDAGYGATDASDSNFLGWYSGYQALNAKHSTFIGYGSGRSATNASNSIFIGQYSGYNDTVNNTTDVDDWSILLGYRTTTGGFKNSILLGGATSTTYISNTKANQFMLAPSITELRWRDVDYTLPSAQGGVGTVLTNDGSGGLTWASGGSSMVYPGAGIPNSTGSAWGTSYTTSGSGTTLALTTTPTFTTNITTPLILGGTSTTQDLTFQTTSGIGTTGADMHFLVGNNGATEAMTILNNGNVGIGTIAPQASLHVNYPTSGNVVFQAGTGDGGSDMDIKYGYNGYGWYNRYLGSGSADNNEWQLWSEGAGGTDKQVYGIKQSGNIDFKEKVSIGTAGNTGPTLDIKTGTAPFTALKLTNYNTDAESLFAGVVSDSNIFLGTGYYYNSSLYRTPGTAASIARFEGGAFKIFTDSGLTANVDYTPTERFRITASGNVGVGEDNPLYKLHTSADSTTYAYGIYQNNVAGNGQYIWVNNADSSKDALQIDNSSNAIFTIKNDGKVGIGEYSPTSALTIGGSGTKAINRSVNTGNLDIYGGTDYTNGAYFKLTGSALNTNPGNSSGEFTIGEEAGTYASNFSIYSYNGGIWTPRFRLFGSTGNVGIGVLNPAEKLDVFGNTGGTYLKIHDQRSTTGDVAGIKLGTMPSGYDASMKTMIAHVETGSYGTGDLVFALNSLADISEVTLSDEKMRIKSNGNVQFGNNTSASTASPLNVSFGGTYGSNTPGDVGNLKWDMFTNGSTGNRYGIGMSLNLMEYQAGTSGQHAFFVNQGTEAMRISSGGNVGINNTNPDSLFSINSPTDDVSIMTLRFPAGSNNERVGILFKGNDGTYNINYAEMIGGVENWSADDGFIGFRTANNTSLAERARLTSNGTFEIGYNYTGQSGTLSDGLIVEGRTLLGATSEAVSSSKLYIEGTTSANGSSSAIAGILGGYTFNPTAGGVQVGNRFVVTNSPTTTANTAVGEIIRMVDSSTLANLVRGLDITSNAGSNTAGTNTGLRASGATFGIQGVTNALAGGVSIPAAIYGESTGTTQGDVLRLYSNTMTSASSFATFYHDTSTFTGTGLLMDFATGSGTFSGNFADFQKNNTSLFKVTNTGIVSMGLGSTSSTTAVCSSLATATSPTSGVAYEIRDCSSAPVADYAEMYPVEIDVTYGDIVTTGEEMINTYDTTNGEIDWNKVKGKISKLKKSNKPYDKKIIGIVSENYGDFSSVGYNIKESDNPKPVALNGRVPVKISEASLPIEIGDYITSSSENGKGMKAVKAGFVIGKALSSWSPNEGKDTVMIFIEQGYYNGEESANLISIDIESLGDTEVNFAEEILKKLLEKDISVENNYISEIFTDRLIAGLEIITPSITTNNLLASGEVTFNGLTYFNKEVEFAKSIKFNEAPEFVIPPLFNSDTAGFAVIKEGAQSVRIDFENPYVTTPVVNTTITFEKENEIDLESFFSSDLKSVVINKDQTGFTIVLNKRAPLDISFSWMALAVKDAKVFESLIDGLEIEYFDEEESEISEVNTQNQTTGNDFKVDIEDESQIDVVSEDVLNQNETIFETQDELGNSSSDEEANVDEVVASEDSILETSIGDDVLEEDLAEEMVSEMNNEIIQEESNPVEDFVNTE